MCQVIRDFHFILCLLSHVVYSSIDIDTNQVQGLRAYVVCICQKRKNERAIFPKRLNWFQPISKHMTYSNGFPLNSYPQSDPSIAHKIFSADK